MTQHTQGEWKATGCKVYSDHGELVAHCPPIGASIGFRNGFPEAEANARLIAAAPKLLEALQLVKPFMDEHDSYHNEGEQIQVAIDAINAAIAAATKP